MSTAEKSATAFLNVDLDIQSRAGLDELISLLSSSVIVLHKTQHEASVELNESYTSLEDTVVGWINLIESLPPEARDILSRCESRSMNIGVQAGSQPKAAMFAISRETTSRLAEWQFELVFTVYARLD